MRRSILLAVLFVAPVARSQVFLSWCSPKDFPAYGVVTADFDEDGLADVAKSNIGAPPRITIHLGQPDGTLQTATELPLTAVFTKLESADFDGDGHADVLANGQIWGTNFVSLLGDGDAILTIAQSDQGSSPYSSIHTLGDVDGDGVIDAVIAAWQGPGEIRIGVGDGTFLPPTPLAVAAGRPVGVALGDLNSDGAQDLVVAHTVGKLLSSHLNLGGGSFGPPKGVFLPSSPSGLALDDLNSDGRLDAAVPQDWAGVITVLSGDGTGQLRSPQTFATNPWPTRVRTGDFDADGQPELVVAHHDGPYWDDDAPRMLSVHRRGPSGWSASEGISADACADFDLGDFDGNGTLDAVAAKPGALEVAAGGGDGLLTPPVIELTGNQHDVLATDIDGDGRLDAITTSATGAYITVLTGDGSGSFGAPQVVAFPLLNGPIEVKGADVSGDGQMDVVTANMLDGSVGVLLGQSGMIGAPSFFAAGAGARDVIAADFDGDGDTDLLTANDEASTVSLLNGSGKGRFVLAIEQAVSEGPVSLDLADIDADGHLDAVVTCKDAAEVVELLADGAGGWTTAIVDSGPANLKTATLADLSGDGPPDLLVVRDVYVAFTGFHGHLAVRLGDGFGSFGAATELPIEAGTIDLQGRDLDADGYADVLITQSDPSEPGAQRVLTLLPGVGPAQFGPAQGFCRGFEFAAISAGDLNGDGAVDQLALVRKAERLVSLLNRTGPAGP